LLGDAARALIREARGMGLTEDAVQRLLAMLMDPTVTAAVLGLIKSGKSTFLNALLGNEFLPSAALPATATITTIVHSSAEKTGRLMVLGPDESKVDERSGREAINEAIRVANERRRDDPSTSLLMMQLKAEIPSFQRIKDASGFELVDTPGSNEHGAGLEAEVDRVLQQSDVIFYVLDFTKIGTDDEARMLEKLKENVLPLLETATGSMRRVFYILNKIDCRSKANDPPLDVILQTVADKINEVMPPGAHVSSDEILPISASRALLARQIHKGRRDQGYLEDLLRQSMGDDFEDLKVEEYEAKALEKAPRLEKNSGIDVIETKMAAVVREERLITLLSVLDRLKEDLLLLKQSLQPAAREGGARSGRPERTRCLQLADMCRCCPCSRPCSSSKRDDRKLIEKRKQKRADIEALLNKIDNVKTVVQGASA